MRGGGGEDSGFQHAEFRGIPNHKSQGFGSVNHVKGPSGATFRGRAGREGGGQCDPSIWFDAVVVVPHLPDSLTITKANLQTNRIRLPVPNVEPWMYHASTVVCGVMGSFDEGLISSPSEPTHDLLSSVANVNVSRRLQQVVALPISEARLPRSLTATAQQ